MEPSKTKTYIKCSLCELKFSKFFALHRHMKYYHKFDDFTCSELNCSRRYKHFSSYRRHYLEDHLCKPTKVGVMSSSGTPPELCNVSNEAPFVNGETIIAPSSSTMSAAEPVTPITTGFAKLYSYMYSSPQIPLFVAEEISKRITVLLNESVKPLWERYDEVIREPLEIFSSEYKRMNYFESLGSFIRPEKHVIGSREEFTGAGGGILRPVECLAYKIPLRKVLKRFFSLEGVLKLTLDHVRKLESHNSTNLLLHFIQGSCWKSRKSLHGDKTVWPIFLQIDDFEPLNCIGSHSTIYKLGAAYCSLPVLPDSLKSRLTCIFLVLLYFSSDRVEFGNRRIFQPLIDEFNFLIDHGIEFDTPEFKGTVYFELALILGDNLGIHSVTGFVESFSSNFPCRMCKVHKTDMTKQMRVDKSILRTMENYLEDLTVGDVTLTGVKEKCIWLAVRNFDLFTQTGVDVMHDIHEGVMKYVMAKLIVTLIVKEKFFTLEAMNFKICNFDLGPDKKDRPVALTIENLRKGNVRLSASEMATFFRYFGVMLGNYVPRGNKYWYIYILLSRIMDSVMNSRGLTVSEIKFMQLNIEELCNLYVSLFDEKLKPKFHFLLHYEEAVMKFGPLRDLSSMRFEAKHRLGKLASKTTCNRINLPFTIAQRHQLMLNNILMQGKLPSHIESSPTCKAHENVELKKIFNGSDSVKEVEWITVDSSMYKKGCVLIYDIVEDNMLAFIEIDKCYIDCTTQKIAFSAYPLHTDHFDEHYYAYLVRYPTKTEPPILLEYDKFLSPFPCNTTFLTYRDGSNCYVVLRKPI